MLSALSLRGQDKPVGFWESLLPYNSAVGIATDGNKLYTAGKIAFFTCDAHTNELQTYSKVEGMSDIGLQCIGFDLATSTTVLVYGNGNIDLFKDNTFYNIPDLKLKVVAGSKTVNAVITDNGYAYMSTSIGLIVLDLQKHTIYKTYQLAINNEILPVTGFAISGNQFYMATTNGLYRANKNSPQLQNFQEWHVVDTAHNINAIAQAGNQLMFANQTSVFALDHDTLRKVFTPANGITHIDGSNAGLLISTSSKNASRVMIMSPDMSVTDSFDCAGTPMQALSLADGTIWVAASDGLLKRTGKNAVNYYVPAGPTNANCYDIYAHDKDVWVAHGGYSDIYFALGSRDGFSNLRNGKWTLYNSRFLSSNSGMRDFVAIVKDEINDVVYAGSYLDGLLLVHEDGTTQTVGDNSIFDGSFAYGDHAHQILGLTFDKSNNLWASLMFAKNQLYQKTPDGNWYKYQLAGNRYGGPIAIDDSGQVWLAALAHGGASAFTNAGTPGDQTDDHSVLLTTGKGKGNLPSNTTFCIACDKKNKIWVGSDKGVGVISGCNAPFTSEQCDAEMPVVKSGPYAGNLLENENVTAISVDGINRKWIGTYNGVFFVSPDGDEILHHFTTENSPLPSNTVRSITIDKITGDVYVGTDLGLVSYHGTATEGAADNSHIKIFPNPVHGDYAGVIAIRGVTANADVRITDISGQLVFATKAQGGQAIWDGKDPLGKRPGTGVYLVFVSDEGGSQTYTGKIVFIQ